MITSLLKVGLLSFISIFNPLKAVSSTQDHTAKSEINLKTDNKKNLYYNSALDYVLIEQSDISKGVFDSFDYPSGTSYQVSLSVEVHKIGSSSTSTYNVIDFQYDDRAIMFNTADDSHNNHYGIACDFYSSISVAYQTSNYTDIFVIDCDWIKISYYNQLGYVDFYNYLKSFTLDISDPLKHNYGLIPTYSYYTGFLGYPSNYIDSFSDFEGEVVLFGDFRVANSNFTLNDNENFTIFNKMVFQQSTGDLIDIYFGDSPSFSMVVDGAPINSNYLVSQTFFMKGDYSIVNRSNYTDLQFYGAFNNCFSSAYEEFTFDEVINYNAMFDLDIKNTIINANSNMIWNLNNKVIFVCDDVFYDSIETNISSCYDKSVAQYQVAQNSEQSDSYYYTYFNNSTYNYVSSIAFGKHYYQSDSSWSGSSLTINNVVNKREVFEQFDNVNNIMRTMVSQNSSFVNSSYRNIKVYYISNSDKQNLLKFNIDSEQLVNPPIDSTNALTSSLNLINITLVGLARFFNFQILPGISLGALIFVPFGITIMLFIVKLFKR